MSAHLFIEVVTEMDGSCASTVLLSTAHGPSVTEAREALKVLSLRQSNPRALLAMGVKPTFAQNRGKKIYIYEVEDEARTSLKVGDMVSTVDLNRLLGYAGYNAVTIAIYNAKSKTTDAGAARAKLRGVVFGYVEDMRD